MFACLGFVPKRGRCEVKAFECTADHSGILPSKLQARRRYVHVHASSNDIELPPAASCSTKAQPSLNLIAGQGSEARRITMSIDPPAYIVSLQNNIRARPISWDGAVRAKTITDEDLKKIKAIDKVRKEQRKATVEGDVQTYTDLLLGNAQGNKSIFESAAKRTDILQYMLVLTGDLIDGMSSYSPACY